MEQELIYGMNSIYEYIQLNFNNNMLHECFDIKTFNKRDSQIQDKLRQQLVLN